MVVMGLDCIPMVDQETLMLGFCRELFFTLCKLDNYLLLPCGFEGF